MGYATVADVEQLAQARVFTATSKPSTTQVVDWLEQTAGVLDGILRAKGYSLPVPASATQTLKLLEGYNAIGAAAFVEQGAPTSDRRDQAMTLWQDTQKMLKDAMLELDDAQDATVTSPRSSFPSAPTPFFTRDMEL